MIPAGIQLSGGGAEGLQTIAMSSTGSSAGTLVHYPGSDAQFIVPGNGFARQLTIQLYPCSAQDASFSKESCVLRTDCLVC